MAILDNSRGLGLNASEQEQDIRLVRPQSLELWGLGSKGPKTINYLARGLGKK